MNERGGAKRWRLLFASTQRRPLMPSRKRSRRITLRLAFEWLTQSWFRSPDEPHTLVLEGWEIPSPDEGTDPREQDQSPPLDVTNGRTSVGLPQLTGPEIAQRIQLIAGLTGLASKPPAKTIAFPTQAANVSTDEDETFKERAAPQPMLPLDFQAPPTPVSDFDLETAVGSNVGSQQTTEQDSPSDVPAEAFVSPGQALQSPGPLVPSLPTSTDDVPDIASDATTHSPTQFPDLPSLTDNAPAAADDYEVTDEISQPLDRIGWLQQIRQPILQYAAHRELSLMESIQSAIEFAPEIAILRAEIGISQAEVTKQRAAFDWNRFIEANWDELNVPVDSDLDGTPNRLENHTLFNSFGLRRQNQLGGNLRLAQDLGLADSNSQFFNPQNQANSRVALEYRQPLLQGAGHAFNTSFINIAIADTSIRQHEFVTGLQSHLLDVISAYWELVRTRGALVVQRRLANRATETAQVVNNRVHLDVGPVQAARARAVLSTRQIAVTEAEYAAVFAQERLLRLVFGQQYPESVNIEIIPISELLGPTPVVDVELETQTALQQRPEVKQALQQIKRTCIERGIAQNQLLPVLGLTLSLSNQGLQGNRGLASAFNDQWSFGDPTYGIGLSYSLPHGNRAAKANLRQRQLQIKKFQHELAAVTSDVVLDVRIASQRLALASAQRSATDDAAQQANQELNALQVRADLLLDGDNVGPLYLNDLLQTQERLATAELSFLTALTDYALALFELQRANGSLLCASDRYVGRVIGDISRAAVFLFVSVCLPWFTRSPAPSRNTRQLESPLPLGIGRYSTSVPSPPRIRTQ